MTEAELIAASLTEAQRSVLVGQLRPWRPRVYISVKAHLTRKGLAEPGMPLAFTPLGEEVRALLNRR